MIWFVLALMAAVLFVVLLLLQQRYQNGLSNRALEELEQLRTDIRDLSRRVENLEAIAAQDEPRLSGDPRERLRPGPDDTDGLDDEESES